MSYCPATPEDLEIYRRMSPGVRAVYALGEVGDWITTRVVVKPGREHDECSNAFRATHGLPDQLRSALAAWAMAKANVRWAAAQLAEAEGALA